MDDVGRSFSVRATFSFGSDYVTTFTLDDPCDLTDCDWRSRFDHAVFADGPRWPQ